MTTDASAGKNVLASLKQRVRDSLSGGLPGIELSPLLPAAWPPQPASAGAAGAEILAYQSQALPSGIVAYRITGPKSIVSIVLPAGTFSIRAAKDGKSCGTKRDAGPGPDAGDSAEQALLDVLLGKRTPEAARKDLDGYSQWVSQGSVIAKDVKRRKTAFFTWLAMKGD